MGQQWPAQGQGLLLQQTWKALHVSLTWSHQADNPQAGEQFYQRNSHTVMEVLGPTTDFPTWDLAKELRPLREFDFGGQWDLATELPQDWGNRLLEGTNKTLCAPGPRRKEQ